MEAARGESIAGCVQPVVEAIGNGHGAELGPARPEPGLAELNVGELDVPVAVAVLALTRPDDRQLGQESGYSSFRQSMGSEGWSFGVRSSSIA